MTSLNKVKAQKWCKIVKISQEENEAVYRRFLELGFAVGEKVKIVSKSLLNKVFFFVFRGYLLSVRANLLEIVEVEVCR